MCDDVNSLFSDASEFAGKFSRILMQFPPTQYLAFSGPKEIGVFFEAAQGL